ncbi:MAG: glutaredoxin family protein [Elusimicrobia bacterium]|nr:glutaredoxin family protein [Elusimicrobiota bacterium]
MKKIHNEGKKVGDIILYALSTCIWCKKTKQLLKDLGIDFYYVDVDLLDKKDMKAAEKEIMKWNPDRSFPTLVKDNKFCITGYKPDEIKEKVL